MYTLHTEYICTMFLSMSNPINDIVDYHLTLYCVVFVCAGSATVMGYSRPGEIQEFDSIVYP